MARRDQRPELDFVVTNALIVKDIQRSVAFYRDVLGATVLRGGEPTRRGNIWLTLTAAAVGPTTSLTSWLRRHAIPTFLASF